MRYGWRALIARITPNTNVNGVEEMRIWAPSGVVVTPTWIPLQRIDSDDLRSMMEHLESAARLIAGVKPDVIIQCPSLGADLLGVASEEEMVRRLEEATGVKTITMHSATEAAIKHLGIDRLAFVGPYPKDLVDASVKQLEDSGIGVVAQRHLGVSDPRLLPFTTSEDAYKACREILAGAPDANGVFFAGGGHRTFDMIEALELATGVPVVTSNQAAFWMALRTAGVNDKIPSLGRLLN